MATHPITKGVRRPISRLLSAACRESESSSRTYVPSGLFDAATTRSKVTGSTEIPEVDFSGSIGGRVIFHSQYFASAVL